MRTFDLSKLSAMAVVALLSGSMPSVADDYDERYTVMFEAPTYIVQCRDPSWLTYIGEASTAEEPFLGMAARMAEAQLTPFLDGLDIPMCDFLADASGKPYQVTSFSGLRLVDEEEIELVGKASIMLGMYIYYDEQGLPLYSVFGFPVSESGKKMPGHDAILFFMTPSVVE